MLEPGNNDELPPIPGKRYFTIGEVSDLCGVKPHVLRYWEQEFPQLKPVKRRGNRRYYQRQDVLIIRQIRSLLYEDGFTIGGARQKLTGDEARTDTSQSQQIIKQVRIELEDVLKLTKGAVVPLDNLAGDPVDIYVNGRLIARGEVLVLNDNFCVRVGELIVGESAVA